MGVAKAAGLYAQRKLWGRGFCRMACLATSSSPCKVTARGVNIDEQLEKLYREGAVCISDRCRFVVGEKSNHNGA